MFKNARLSVKIATGFGAVILVGLILGGITVTKNLGLQRSATSLADCYMPETEETMRMRQGVQGAMYAMRGFGFTGEAAFLQRAEEQLAEAEKRIQAASELAVQFPELVALVSAVDEIKPLKAHYERMVDETRSTYDSIIASRKKLDESAAQFAALCSQYLADEESSLMAAIKSGEDAENLARRALKVRLTGDVIATGYGLRLAVWKAQTLRDVAAFDRVLPRFGELEDLLSQIRDTTRDSSKLANIEQIAAATTTYQTATEELMSHLKNLNRLAQERDKTGSGLLAVSTRVSDAGMKHATEIAHTTQSSLAEVGTIVMGGQAVALVLGVLLAALISRAIVKPIRQGVEFAKTVAAGDFTQRLDIHGKDEVGTLASALNGMADNLGNMVRRLTDNAETLASASTELSATAAQLASGAEETTNQSATVASAAEEMSTNMASMAASTEQMSNSVSTVASAIEQLNASIGEVAKNADRAASVAGNADQLAHTSNDRINELGSAADAIGKVIETIQDIADQTNLLALNATIEAARAGDAGKGFAVVATEVKELARQSAEATEDIRKRIEGIQSSAEATVQSISEISEVIRNVNEVSRTIATAVEEQSSTTQAIARSVAESSSASQTVSCGVSESAAAAQEITRNISSVDEAARQAVAGAAQTQIASEQLSELGERLREMVQQFKV